MTAAFDPNATKPGTTRVVDHEVLIVGSGFSGLGAGIKLKKIGIHDFIILEKAGDLGGTWRDNTYPGLTVDIPTLTYSFSFEQNPNWSNLYAPGPELKQYADHCSDKYGVRSHIRFNASVAKSVYDDQLNRWSTHLETGDVITSRYLVSATGFLTVVKMPDIPGIDDFKGKKIHTARWDHQHDLTGERVGFIGTGATAIQVIPEIVPKLKSLAVYQRTPIWLLPKRDAVISEGVKKLFRRVPPVQKVARFFMYLFTDMVMITSLLRYKRYQRLLTWIEGKCIAHIRNQVHDPAIQEKLIPKYSFGCKRPSFTNKFYPVFNRDNVELVTTPIERITAKGIVTSDGVEREMDTLICATGFQVFEKGVVPTFRIYGKNGVELSDFWEENRYSAFMGASVPNYPNYFMVFGPYSICSASWFGMIETQTRHLARCLQAARRRHANYIEVKQEAHDRDFQDCQRRRLTSIFVAGDCVRSNSYYYDRHGDNPAMRPSTSAENMLRSFLFSMDNYHFATK